jgi:hypothetical protein
MGCLRESRIIKTPMNLCVRYVVIRLVMPAILVVGLFGCATSRAPVEENDARITRTDSVEEDAEDATRTDSVEGDAAHATKSDQFREYSVSLEELFEACKAACKDVGADYHEPHYNLRDAVATIVAASRTHMYGVIMQVYENRTQVLLAIEFPEGAPAKPRAEELKRIYNDFWTALETRLYDK